jgi:hypothetical protein
MLHYPVGYPALVGGLYAVLDRCRSGPWPSTPRWEPWPSLPFIASRARKRASRCGPRRGPCAFTLASFLCARLDDRRLRRTVRRSRMGGNSASRRQRSRGRIPSWHFGGRLRRAHARAAAGASPRTPLRLLLAWKRHVEAVCGRAGDARRCRGTVPPMDSEKLCAHEVMRFRQREFWLESLHRRGRRCQRNLGSARTSGRARTVSRGVG